MLPKPVRYFSCIRAAYLEWRREANYPSELLMLQRTDDARTLDCRSVWSNLAVMVPTRPRFGAIFYLYFS
jgi:hypothetical protein